MLYSGPVGGEKLNKLMWLGLLIPVPLLVEFIFLELFNFVNFYNVSVEKYAEIITCFHCCYISIYIYGYDYLWLHI